MELLIATIVGVVLCLRNEVKYMVRGIKFNAERFDTKDDNNLMNPITENTVVICNNRKLIESLEKEIISTINGKAEYNDYDCDIEDVGKARSDSRCDIQKVIDINGQKIILSLEPAIIYRAEKIEDVWFYDWYGIGESYREQIYPLIVFKGSRDKWNEGRDAVYNMIIAGRYGGYDGSWVVI